MEHLMKRRDSAAAILCHLIRDFTDQESQKPCMQDIIGIVALLGTVSNNKLSRSFFMHVALSYPFPNRKICGYILNNFLTFEH